MKLDHLGVMLDCSRNGVLKPESVKRYIDILSCLGYNCLMLYTEDTYEVDNQPYFGYLRGRYSQAELKALDAYAASKGIELIPCIQTLAHLNGMSKWKVYKPFIDIDDILLCDDPRTEQLIEDMFSTLEKCFTSRTVNIGMDEAHMLGRGKYMDLHGYQDRFEILLRHLNKVCEIAKRHGFKPLMWSDMFFRLANSGQYYGTNPISKEVIEKVPESVSLVYWDYYGNEKERYDTMIKAHQSFHNEIWFAGGFWTWRGFAPKNAMSIKRTDLAMSAVAENGVQNVIFTVWGDGGAECSPFAILPSLYYAAQRAKGIGDMELIKTGFQQEFGMAFDDFLLLDLPYAAAHAPDADKNPEKYMLYNDCFSGWLDCTVPEGFEPKYAQVGEKLAALANHPEFGYLFDAEAKLCAILQKKFTLGVRTRKLYRSGDIAGLKALIEDYEQVIALLEPFYQAHKARWFKDNKPFGFEIQDARLGGLKQRMTHCKERLEAYVAGEISVIEELDEDILPEYGPEGAMSNNWKRQISINVK